MRNMNTSLNAYSIENGGKGPADYEELLPAALPEAFTARELAQAMKLPAKEGTSLAGVYAGMELLKGEKQGNKRIWRRKNAPPNSAENVQK